MEIGHILLIWIGCIQVTLPSYRQRVESSSFFLMVPVVHVRAGMTECVEAMLPVSLPSIKHMPWKLRRPFNIMLVASQSRNSYLETQILISAL